MAKFIPIDKMSKLREASRSGDERAKKMLAMQMNGTEDFSSLMDEFFKPQPTEQAQVEEAPTGATSTYGLKEATSDHCLEDFLKFNGITKDSADYQSYVDDYYKENPKPQTQNGLGEHLEDECEVKKQLLKVKGEEIDAIDSYSKGITIVMNDTKLEPNKKRKIISRFKEIRADEEEHAREIDELLELLNSEEPEEEKNEGTVE